MRPDRLETRKRWASSCWRADAGTAGSSSSTTRRTKGSSVPDRAQGGAEQVQRRGAGDGAVAVVVAAAGRTADCDPLAGAQGTPANAAQAGAQIGRRAAELQRNVEATRQRQSGAGAPAALAKLEPGAGLGPRHGHGGEWLSVEGSVEVAAGQGKDDPAGEDNLAAGPGDFQRRGRLEIAHQPVRQPVRVKVHGARGAHAESAATGPSQILNRGCQTGSDDLERREPGPVAHSQPPSGATRMPAASSAARMAPARDPAPA